MLPAHSLHRRHSILPQTLPDVSRGRILGRRVDILMAVFRLLGCLTVALAGCADALQEATSAPDEAAVIGPASVFPATAARTVLFCGNSHTTTHNVAAVTAALCTASDVAGAGTEVSVLSGSFLDAIAGDSEFETILSRDDPDVVVLQGQKVSMSGRHVYPRDAAEGLARAARAAGARVLLYAEWGRQGVEGETERIESIYQQISETAGGDVVPVGKAWQRASTEYPEFVLYARDGNHASPMGAFLTSCVLASTLTGVDPASAAAQVDSPIPEADRRRLARIAWAVVQDSTE